MKLSEKFERTVRVTGPDNKELEKYKLQQEYYELFKNPGVRFPITSNCYFENSNQMKA